MIINIIKNGKEIITTIKFILKDVKIPNNWGHSSAGRAPAWHAGGQEFESPWLHKSCIK